MACIGTRRSTALRARSSKKGVKLDFKVVECVEPALRHLQSVEAAKKLEGHLWLNADVLAGPGYPDRFLSPIDARNFVQLCAELVPEAVLSLPLASIAKPRQAKQAFRIRPEELGEHDLVHHEVLHRGHGEQSLVHPCLMSPCQGMIELCMSPIVPRPIRARDVWDLSGRARLLVNHCV